MIPSPPQASATETMPLLGEGDDELGYSSICLKSLNEKHPNMVGCCVGTSALCCVSALFCGVPAFVVYATKAIAAKAATILTYGLSPTEASSIIISV